ncbi:DoxX family protein [[Mycobacterium] wendilense]|uniref:DoxX family protein n=1 Tax=[Mycobacterium] wendilense TaxID=3064284 RepID=A0ABN9NYW2_9MYCO|nr:DoxX family protein [Mycolicibacterium sp. MU0050]CAJ1583001.1 DoxX family protein [Mycolicibacterium sp. MU0050]
MLLRRIARPLLAAAFIGQGVEALRSPKPAAEAAQPTLDGLQKLPEPVSSNVPQNAETLARITAAAQIGGGVLLATGKVPRLASAVLATTVIPGNLGAHMFWQENDPQLKAQKRREFLTDVSLLGGLMIASADTAGKPSLGWRGRRAAAKLSDTVSSALPGSAGSHGLLDSEFTERIGHRLSEGLHVGAERGRELAGAAAERSAPLLDTARERGAELAGEVAHVARERGGELAHVARERGGELAHVARERGGELAQVARERGGELAETARDRSGELAKAARHQGEDVASEARKRARKRRLR